MSKIIQYGGALFSDVCKCGESCKMPKSLSVNHFIAETVANKLHIVSGTCTGCGKVELPFVGWA